MSWLEVSWKCEDSLHGELGKERPHQLVWMFTSLVGHRSRMQAAVVASGREGEWRTGIAGIARSLTRVQSTNVMVVSCAKFLRHHGHQSLSETCVACLGSSERSHTGIVTGELVYVWRRVQKNGTDARTALVTNRWYGPAIVVGNEKNNVFVSHRGRVTKVASECLRKASVAEQMSCDITTKQKAMFENALDERTFRWKNPCSTNLVDFLIQRRQIWRRNPRISKKRPIHP